MKLGIACIIAVVASGCVDAPFESTDADVSILAEPTTSLKTAALDILFVVDNASSMCAEQAVLAQTLNGFLDSLEQFIPTDFRVALINSDVVTSGGTFLHHPRRQLDAKCNSDRLVPAGMCSQLGVDWQAPDGIVLNWQGEAFERCRLPCETSVDCEAALVDPSAARHCEDNIESCEWQCTKAPIFDDTKSCAFRPPTNGCPSANDWQCSWPTERTMFRTSPLTREISFHVLRILQPHQPMLYNGQSRS